MSENLSENIAWHSQFEDEIETISKKKITKNKIKNNNFILNILSDVKLLMGNLLRQI